MSNIYEDDFDSLLQEAPGLNEDLEGHVELDDPDPDEVQEEPVKYMVAENSSPPPAVSKRALFDFSSINSIPGVIVGDVGLELSRYPVEKMKFTAAARSLVALVAPQVIAIKVHYSEEFGNFVCFSGACCEDHGLAKVRYLFPIVVYDTDKRGAPVSKDVTFKVLALGKESYDDIKTITELSGDITQMDLLITCKDEQYQKVSVQQAGACRWRKDREVAKSVVKFWRETMKDLLLPVARVLTREDYAKKMQSISAIETTMTENVDLESLFDD